jgi:RNA polymerase sigma factor (sigma-70 family)
MQVPRTRAELVLSLFDNFYERVYAFLRKSTTPEVAEDLAQEVFVRLLQHPELERLTISVSYLLKIAHNLLRRRYARANRLRELLSERHVTDSTDGGFDTETLPIAVDGQVLQTAMGLLTSDEHSAVRLIVCEGRSYQHAARSLGVTVTTINNWKHRGLSKLRRYLADAERGQCAGHHHGPSSFADDFPVEEARFDALRSAAARGRDHRSRPLEVPRERRERSWYATTDDVA